jgi:CDP-4-dehydro-6-deoxyglucose reductase
MVERNPDCGTKVLTFADSFQREERPQGVRGTGHTVRSARARIQWRPHRRTEEVDPMPRLTVEPEGVAVDLRGDETILEGLYRNGYAYRIGCRRGGCAICKVDLVHGEVEYNRPVAETVLTTEERSTGTCLSCRAVASTDVTITLRADNLRRVNPLLARLTST